MKRLLALMFAALFVVVLGHVAPTRAFATVSSFFAGCSTFSASGTTNAPYIAVNVRIPNTDPSLFFGSFPVGADGTFNVNVSFTPPPVGTLLEYSVWGGPLPGGWYDGESFFATTESCLPSSFTGAGIPAGFVMHNIVCTVPVYTQPAGVPVGNDRVLSGQTWFVNPTPVEGADGEQWTEIFVGSAINPWIPTECVGEIAPLTPEL